ncbi:MAG TPA: HEAT repeat domain-containing protein [Blastocatellia bacterium]|nr:HEAT repeat domain-containing protein [Blastocatellia bacterium]
MSNKISLALCALLWALSFGLAANAQELYTQCEALKAGGEPPAEVKKNLEALGDKDAKARARAARSLATSCDKRAVEPLVGRLGDPDPQVRAAAVEALGRLGDREAIDPMIEALNKEEDWGVRYVYAPALASFQIHRASYAVLNGIAGTMQKVRTEPEMRTRCYAILIVDQLRDVNFSRKGVGFLFSFLDHEDPALRKIAEQTVVALKDTRNGKHELMGMLRQSHNPDFLIKAANWIGRLGIEDARPVLEEMVTQDLDPRVQKAVRESLAALDKKQTTNQ